MARWLSPSENLAYSLYGIYLAYLRWAAIKKLIFFNELALISRADNIATTLIFDGFHAVTSI